MSDERPILVLGGTGQLGTALIAELQARGRRVAAPPRKSLDLARTEGLRPELERLAPSAVINAAAYNDVTRADEPPHSAEAFLLNRDLPAALAGACAASGVPLIHVSTDYVFDGAKREPYHEEDPTGPLQVYGQSKLAGERAVLERDGAFLVARTSTVFGPSCRSGSNYVDTILRQARDSGRLQLVRPPVASPTYAPDLALALIELLEAGATGLVHVANAGGCSRVDLAREVLRCAGLDSEVGFEERPEPQGGTRRPAYSVLDTSRLAGLIGRPMRTWQVAVAAHVAT